MKSSGTLRSWMHIWVMKGWAMLEVRDLEVCYGKFPAVQGLSLEVDEGEIVSLIGANGAGKSSTLRAICGIEKTDAGEVRFLGEVITGLALSQNHPTRYRSGAGRAYDICRLDN